MWRRVGQKTTHFHFITSIQPFKTNHHTTTTILWPFFRDHPGEPVPEENFWTLRCKRRLTEADTQTIRLGDTPSGITSVHLHHPPFLQAGCPSCRPINSFKALKATSAFRLGRRRWSSPQQCYVHCLRTLQDCEMVFTKILREVIRLKIQITVLCNC